MNTTLRALCLGAGLIGYAVTSMPLSANANESPTQKFLTADSLEQQQILAALNSEKIGSMDRAGLEQILVVATRASSMKVRQEALVVITRLVPLDAETAKRVATPEYLATIVSKGSQEAALSAYEVSTLLHRDEQQIRDAVEIRLREKPVEEKFDRRVIRYLSTKGDLPAAALPIFQQWASTRDDALGFEAAAALARLDRPSPDLVSSLLRLASTKQYFAHPDLIGPLAKFAPLSRDQSERLRKIKQRFDTEIAKPAFERSVSIYNDDLYSKVLANVFAEVFKKPR